MAQQTISDGMVVSLAYRLYVEGKEVARMEANEPMEYLHGAQNIVPGLENALVGKKVGDKFSVTLTPEEAYGDYDDEDMETIDRNDIPDADQLELDMVVEVEDPDGYTYMAHVKEITGDSVVLDFNPPLAGKTLTYDVEVVSMREADDEELSHGHAHGMMWDEDDEEFEDDEDFDDEEFEDDEEDATQ